MRVSFALPMLLGREPVKPLLAKVRYWASVSPTFCGNGELKGLLLRKRNTTPFTRKIEGGSLPLKPL